MVFAPFCKGWLLKKMQNAAAPTKELKVGSKFGGGGTSRIAVVPASALRVERGSWGQRPPDHPGVPPDAAGQARDPRVHAEANAPHPDHSFSI